MCFEAHQTMLKMTLINFIKSFLSLPIHLGSFAKMIVSVKNNYVRNKFYCLRLHTSVQFCVTVIVSTFESLF